MYAGTCQLGRSTAEVSSHRQAYLRSDIRHSLRPISKQIPLGATAHLLVQIIQPRPEVRNPNL